MRHWAGSSRTWSEFLPPGQKNLHLGQSAVKPPPLPAQVGRGRTLVRRIDQLSSYIYSPRGAPVELGTFVRDSEIDLRSKPGDLIFGRLHLSRKWRMLFSGLSNCRSLEPAGKGGDVKLFFLLHCIFPMITQKNISRPYWRNFYHSCTRSRPSRDVASTGLSWTLWPLWKTKWDVSCFTFSCSTHRPPCSLWSLFLRSLGTVRTCSGRRCRGWRVCWRCCGRSSSAPGLSLSSCRPCALSPSVCCSPPSGRPSPFSSDHWRGEGKCRDWELTLKSSVSLWRGSSNLGSCTSSTSARSTLFTICR